MNSKIMHLVYRYKLRIKKHNKKFSIVKTNLDVVNKLQISQVPNSDECLSMANK